MNKPKYEFRQKVWTIEGDEVREGTIYTITKFSDKEEIYYSLNSRLYFSDIHARIPESKIFTSKEELIKSL